MRAPLATRSAFIMAAMAPLECLGRYTAALGAGPPCSVHRASRGKSTAAPQQQNSTAAQQHSSTTRKSSNVSAQHVATQWRPLLALHAPRTRAPCTHTVRAPFTKTHKCARTIPPLLSNPPPPHPYTLHQPSPSIAGRQMNKTRSTIRRGKPVVPYPPPPTPKPCVPTHLRSFHHSPRPHFPRLPLH